MAGLNEADFDQLALDGCEVLGFKSGSTVAYDLAGYDRVERVQVAPGSLRTQDYVTPPVGESLPVEARFAPESYPSRIAGFQRRSIFGPDEVGRLAAERAIAWNDGLGNGLYELLRIDRKFGLKHVLEPPVMGFDLPYLPADRPAFQLTYSGQVDRLKKDLSELEPVYRGPLAQPGERMLVQWCRHTPLSLFAEAYAGSPISVANDLEKEIGWRDLPVRPATPPERAALAHFWALVRRREGELAGLQAAILRQRLGPGLTIVANNHELPPMDMGLQGRVFDYPAVAVRPLLLDDELMLRHYVAYFTRLFLDLTGKAPMVSVRMNLSAASPRFLPSPALIRQWYDQAVRFGAGAFYFWTRDYPYSDAPGVYDGPMPGNPDERDQGRQRFETVIDLLGHLAGRQRFLPPQPQAAILVPNELALLDRAGWRRIYGLFSACAEARLHTGFISDRTIEANGAPESLRLLLAPSLEFISPALRQGLENFSRQGGTLLAADAPFYDKDGLSARPLVGAQSLDIEKVEVFPVGQPGSLSKMVTLAETMRRIAQRAGIDFQGYVFNISSANLPTWSGSQLRPADPGLEFSPWLYEHGSPWIMPYI